MIILREESRGCVFGIMDGALMSTPVYDDLTYGTCSDNWVECDVECMEDDGEKIYKMLVKCEDMAYFID